jgi:hypothetical protein
MVETSFSSLDWIGSSCDKKKKKNKQRKKALTTLASGLTQASLLINICLNSDGLIKVPLPVPRSVQSYKDEKKRVQLESAK